MEFNEDYTKYWKKSVNKSIDGILIAGHKQAKYYLDMCGIKKQDILLDLGCSYGRMYEILSEYSAAIYGVDPDPYAIEVSRESNYLDLKLGTAEDTGFDNNFFDVVFCWAVFDVVDHKKSLIEINRVLRNGGKLIFTGKNSCYLEGDNLAYVAEKNAFLKGFPNKFSDLKMILKNFKNIGFQLDGLFAFKKRGDFGMSKFVEVKDILHSELKFYEYLIICHKVSESSPIAIKDIDFDSEFSEVANDKALTKGFSSPAILFAQEC